MGNDLVAEVVGFWDIRKQLKSLSINNRFFLFGSEPKSRPFIIILYTIGHTHKKKHWQNLWNNSQRIEFSFSEQLLNPFRGWNFLKDLEHSWRAYACMPFDRQEIFQMITHIRLCKYLTQKIQIFYVEE